MMRDPVELEIVKNALTSIAEEMATVALKSAFSIILKESGDASSAICDRYGRLVAQTASATLYHLASFRPSLRELIADFPLETMRRAMSLCSTTSSAAESTPMTSWFSRPCSAPAMCSSSLAT